MTAYILVTSEGSEVINVQAFDSYRKAVAEKYAIEAEPDFSEDTHSIEIYEKTIQ